MIKYFYEFPVLEVLFVNIIGFIKPNQAVY